MREGYKMDLRLDSEITSSERRLELQDIGTVRLFGSEDRALLDVVPDIRALRSLLQIATSSQVCILSVRPNLSASGGIQPTDAFSHSTSFFGSPISIPGPSDREVFHHQLLFSFPDIEDFACAFISRWLDRWHKMEAAQVLFAATAYRSDVVLEELFFNIVRVCEAFHRIAIGGFEVSAEDHQSRIDEILHSCPGPHRKWLQSKLHFSNELGLRRRLKDLWHYVGPEVTNHLPVSRSHLVARTVELRNLLTHYSEVYRATGPKFSDMHSLARWWTIILEACFLLDSGFPKERLGELYSRNREYRWQRFLELRDLQFTAW